MVQPMAPVCPTSFSAVAGIVSEAASALDGRCAGERFSATNEAEHALRCALSCLNSGALADSVAYAETAIALMPGNGFAHMLLGIALAHAGRRDVALPALEHATRLAPDKAQVRYNFAVTLQEAGHELRAMAEYRHCLECDPDFPDALWNYGELLRVREHFALALACFDRLAAIEGVRRPKAAHRMAVCCAQAGYAERAEALFLEQIAQDDDPVTRWEYAHFLLRQQRFDEVWPHFAQRFDAGEKLMMHGARLPYPQWQGQWQADATLIVTGEQGAGDEILFAAFLPALLARAKSVGMRVVLVCRVEMVRLFRASFPEAQIESPDSMVAEGGTNLRADGKAVWHAHIGDLPRWIDKPEPDVYLTPDADDVSAAHQLIGSCDDQHAQPGQSRPLRVGLVWSANPAVTQSNRVSRNVPSQLVNGWLANLTGVQFYSLMPAVHAERIGEVPDLPLVDLAGFVSDFSRTAAAMQCMDAVVSVCTSSANLAGALGVDLHVLLQQHADWRWAGNGRLWYPRVETYRQQRPGDWSTCLASLSRDLQRKVETLNASV
jgi:tetratricopeptide (TPR) repeat protein